MGTEIGGVKVIPEVWSVVAAAKTCDACKSVAATIFCRSDCSFLCLNCDSMSHWGHERVYTCEVCEQAPATLTCKADAAALCLTCDADIHSGNPLARRHERVAVKPFFDSAESIVKSSPFSFPLPTTDHNDGSTHCEQGIEENNKMKTGDLFFTEMDPFFDFGYAPMASLVPVQAKLAATIPIPMRNNGNCLETDFHGGSSKLSTFGYQTQSSLSHTVSSSSLEVGTVPDGNFQPISSASANENTTRVGGIDREARVLKYKEKRKNRKFEKTIRYASRKAYAESRPRIKGRFAKRTEPHNEVDNMHNSPSFASVAAFMRKKNTVSFHRFECRFNESG